MTKVQAKEIATLSTDAKAVRQYREAAKMLARLHNVRRFHAQRYGKKNGPRARKIVMLEMYPKEWATFLTMLAIGIVLNGDKTKGEMLALLSGKELPDATRPKKALRR